MEDREFTPTPLLSKSRIVDTFSVPIFISVCILFGAVLWLRPYQWFAPIALIILIWSLKIKHERDNIRKNRIVIYDSVMNIYKKNRNSRWDIYDIHIVDDMKIEFLQWSRLVPGIRTETTYWVRSTDPNGNIREFLLKGWDVTKLREVSVALTRLFPRIEVGGQFRPAIPSLSTRYGG